MDVWATLLLAHLIADFPLQTNWVFKVKTQGSWGVGVHVGIHLLVTAVLIKDHLAYWHVLLVLGVAHFITDWVKLRFPGRLQTPGFIVDQIIHWLTLLLITIAVPTMPVLLPTWLLYPILALTLIPALLTCLWILANDLRNQPTPTWPPVEWASQHLLRASQLIGFALVILVGTSSLLAML
ncbi:MAG: DUF3307 domain-containing protein [Anaerolineales bacterium]|nr:DUF3307 domain-containing protein [Anaerolineales bacterium]